MLLGANISNFDVFDDVTCGAVIESLNEENIKLRNLTALIGRNQTGKTSFMEALDFVKDSIKRNVADASTRDGRPGFSNLLIDKDKPCTFKLCFKLSDKRTKKNNESEKYYVQYELTLAATKYGSPCVLNERIIKSVLNDSVLNADKTEPKYVLNTVMELNEGKGFIINRHGEKEEVETNDKHLTALSIWGKIRNYELVALIYTEIMRWFFCRFSCENKTSYFEDGNAPGGHHHLNSEGSNVNNVLEYLKQKDVELYRQILHEIRELIPIMKKNKKLPELTRLSPDRLFKYLLLLRDPEPNSTIFIETPDKDLYHDMVECLAHEMRNFCLKNRFSQIIFSTHNPYIVENMTPNEIWVFKRDNKEQEEQEDKEDFVIIECAGSDKLVRELSNEGVGMGSIWYGGYLD